MHRSELGVEVIYRDTGDKRIRIVINHNATETVCDGQTLAPFQCSISPDEK